MTTLFYILLILAIWHFFYENAIAPSLRYGLKYKFFSLRDDLRKVKINSELSKKDKKIIEILDRTICHMIHSINFITLSNHFKLKEEIKKNIQIKVNIDKTKNLIRTSENTDVNRISSQIKKIAAQSLFINTGSWIIYLIIPIIVLAIGLIFTKKIKEFIKIIITKIITSIIYSRTSTKEPVNSSFSYN